MAKLLQGSAQCVWHSGEGEPIVSASVSLIDAERFAIWLGEELSGARVTTVRLATAARGLRTRVVGVCPKCERNAETLILKGREWKCSRCVHLKRSVAKRLDWGRITEEIGLLKEQVRLGRKPQKWTSKYIQQAARLQNILKDIGGSLADRRWWPSEVRGPYWITNDGHMEVDGEEGAAKARPGYWEAIPSISAIEARREAREGRRLCVWLEPSGVQVGGAEVDVSGDKIVMRYAVHRRPALDAASGDITFQIEYRGSQDNNQRALLKCPVCGQARGALGLLSDLWACRECHRLRHRSAVVGSPVRRAEAYAKQVEELKALEKDGARRTTIEKKKREVAIARKKAGPKPHRIASRDYNFVLSREWRTGAFDMEGFYDV